MGTKLGLRIVLFATWGADAEDRMLQLKLNGKDISVDAPGDMPLLWVLRDIVGMTGTKFGCGVVQCG